MLSTWQIVTLFAKWLNQKQKAPTVCLGRGGWERGYRAEAGAAVQAQLGHSKTQENTVFSGHDPHDAEWAGELTCQGTASWDSRLHLHLLQETNPHLSLFQPLRQIRWSWVWILLSQLISSPFSFSLYFICLMASFKLGKIIVIKHYLVHFKHEPPFLLLLVS